MKTIRRLLLVVLTTGMIALSAACGNGDDAACDGGRYDEATWLCWQHPKADGTFTWQEAIDYCDELDLAGHTDWYLPSNDELIDLLGGCDSGVTNNGHGNCNTCADSMKCSALFGADTDWYWSSPSLFHGGTGDELVFGFDGGFVGADNTGNESRARCVRPGGDTDADSDSDSDTVQAPAMIDCDGGKQDPNTGLCWQNPPSENTQTWADALTYCDSLSLGGFDDWRLPMIQELISLLRGCVDGLNTGDLSISSCAVTDPGCLENACSDSGCWYCDLLEGPDHNPWGCYWDPALAGQCEWDLFWSSSSVASDEYSVWSVGFYSSTVNCSSKNNMNLVRCVRDGP